MMSRSDSEQTSADVIDLEVRCFPDTRMLSPLRTVATALAAERGFSCEDIEKIEMAVDEACANVVRHAYRHLGLPADHEGEVPRPRDPETGKPIECVIRMRITMGPDMLRFQIIDNGIGVDKTPPGAGSVEEYIERGGKGGLGIYIIRNFMDEVSYETPEDCGTILTMTKYRTPAGR